MKSQLYITSFKSVLTKNEEVYYLLNKDQLIKQSKGGIILPDLP